MVKFNVGDVKNGFPVIPLNERPKILFMSDDARTHSGVATMTREIILGILHRFNIINFGALINHPEKGKIIDLSEGAKLDTGLDDVYFRIYASSNYGDPHILRQIIQLEKPDIILHFTDPRQWIWLYQMEHEIRQNIPIFYYNIWDDLPYPVYNREYYLSCDLLLAISKQTYNINKVVAGDKMLDWQIKYVPHGINQDLFYPIRDPFFLKKKKEEMLGANYDFVVMYNSRNIRRKMASDLILAYRTFTNKLPTKDAANCVLVLHTDPIDEHGTNLFEVIKYLAPNDNIILHTDKLNPKDMHFLYNIADVTVGIASNEGFGLSTAESLMCGTPILINVTGGLQDQAGFKNNNGEYLLENDYTPEFPSNHNGRYKTHGEWAKVVFPKTRSIMGSIPTPFIFDDRADWEDVATKLYEWYGTPKEKRIEYGDLGREWALRSDIGLSVTEMNRRFIEYMEYALANWVPRKRYELVDTQILDNKLSDKYDGVLLSEL
jgi:glycosyltransferase involved in cell wall biosynthesis